MASTRSLLACVEKAAQTNAPIDAAVESEVSLQAVTLNWAGQLSIVMSVQQQARLRRSRSRATRKDIIFYQTEKISQQSNLIRIDPYELLSIVDSANDFNGYSVYKEKIIKMEGNSPLSSIPAVSISPEGIFKYILITATITRQGTQQQAQFVRGHLDMEYHKDNFNKFIKEVQQHGVEVTKKNAETGHCWANKGDWKIKLECRGGGRIEHKYQGKLCFIYGYSKSFGRVDHKIAQKMVSQALGYKLEEVTTSQEGY